MNRQEALSKVAKLMRLSKSSNANEAAIALRMAQRLMEDHAIDAAELDESGLEPITDERVVGRGRNTPVYKVALANLVCLAFGVEVIWLLGLAQHQVAFIGPRSRATIATYCYEVLLRQLERDRRKHLSRVRKTKNRNARGDIFGLAWVDGASRQVQVFSGVGEKERIERYRQQEFGGSNAQELKPRQSKAVSHGDAYAGHTAGKSAQINHGVGGSSQARLEHQP